jgi:hypothetical protein
MPPDDHHLIATARAMNADASHDVMLTTLPEQRHRNRSA